MSISSLIPLSSASQLYSNQVTGKTSKPQANPADTFGAAFSVNLSAAGLSALGGDDMSSNSAADTLSPLTYSNTAGNSQSGSSNFEALLASFSSSDSKDSSASGSADNSDQLMKFIQQIMANVENSLESIGSNASGSSTQATSSSSANQDLFGNSTTPDAESALASGGPLPAFLQQVDTIKHLDATQQKALQDIATKFKDANNTPDTVQQIAAALQQAGISEDL